MRCEYRDKKVNFQKIGWNYPLKVENTGKPWANKDDAAILGDDFIMFKTGWNLKLFRQIKSAILITF